MAQKKGSITEERRRYLYSTENLEKLARAREKSNPKGRPKGSVPWNKGVPHTERTRKKISIANRGRIPWNKGIPMRRESIERRTAKQTIPLPTSHIKFIYEIEKLSANQIAKAFGVSEETIYRRLKKCGVLRRTHSEIKGSLHPMFGKRFSPETRKRMGDGVRNYYKTHDGPWKGKERTESVKRAIREARKGRRFPTHNTNPELKFLSLIKKHSLPYRYTGDGSLWIENINPDFVNTNGEKVAVEIFGRYWHDPKWCDWKRTEEGRRRILSKYGWKLIVIWDDEVDDIDLVLTRVGHGKN